MAQEDPAATRGIVRYSRCVERPANLKAVHAYGGASIRVMTKAPDGIVFRADSLSSQCLFQECDVHRMGVCFYWYSQLQIRLLCLVGVVAWLLICCSCAPLPSADREHIHSVAIQPQVDQAGLNQAPGSATGSGPL